MARGTLTGQLAALGFADTERAQALLTADLGLDPDGNDAWLVEALATAADPDLALATLARLAPDAELTAALRADPGLRDRLITVLGVSAALGDHLVRHPADWRVLAGPGALARPSAATAGGLLAAVGADPDAAEPVADAGPDRRPGPGHRAAAGLPAAAAAPGGPGPDRGRPARPSHAPSWPTWPPRRWRRPWPSPRPGCRPGAAPARLAVIAMGKCGGRELNYVSDVDVIFVAAPGGRGRRRREAEAAALRTATALASGMIRVCSQSTAEGALFPVDPNLRPEGRDGPLVRTLASHRAYYERWAKTWEFQALLKARPVAGRRGRWAPSTCADRRPDGVAGRAAAGLRRRRPGHAPPGAGQPARRRGRPGAQARPRRAARHRVRRPAAAARARPGRRDAARGAAPWRRWPRWPPAATSAGPTRPAWRRPTGSCAASSTCSSCAGCAARTCCPRIRRSCARSAGRCAGCGRATRRRRRPR